MLKVIVREISKLIMFTIAWALPVVLAAMFGNTHYLWLFLLSILISAGIFSHYEDLATAESLSFLADELGKDCDE